MQLAFTPIKDVFVVHLNKITDERGFFARFFCQEDFATKGIESQFVQVNNSLSLSKGTLRGMHYQLAPKSEAKLVRCIRGSVYDVVLDLRPESPTFGRWFGQELSADNRLAMYVPKGCAHGFLTLEDNTEIFYFVSEYYSKEFERGIRWNDPAFNISWPFEPAVISEKDKNHPDFNHAYHI